MKKRFFGLLALLLVLAACTQPGPRSVTVVTSPQPNAVDVEVDTDVTATFSVAMNESTLADAMSLSSEEGPVVGTQSYDADARRLTFTPEEPLEFGTEYTASVDRAVRSDAGGRLAGPATGLYSWTFTTVEAPPEDPAVNGVTITNAPAGMLIGESITLEADVDAVGGADETVTWTSSDPDVATIDEDTGELTAVAVGDVTITATSTFDATQSATADITVSDAPAIIGVTITNAPTTMVIGDTLTLEADVEAIGGADETVTWASSDPAVAEIDEDTGELTAVAAGDVTITATSTADPTQDATAAITVSIAPVVNEVTITNAPTGMLIGESITLEADVDAVGGADETVTWESSDSDVAEIDPDTGELTAIAAGDVTITATSTADPTQDATAAITVHAAVSADDYVSAVGYPAGEAIAIAAPAVSGGLAPYTYELTDGELPDGVTLSADGAISGSATVVGDYSGTVTVTDDLGQTDTADFSFVIGEPLVIDQHVGSGSILQMSAFGPIPLVTDGGVAPFTFDVLTIDPSDPDPRWADRYSPDGPWSVHDLEHQGPLAPGLSIDPDTGMLSGTVTEVGYFRTYVLITDSIGQSDATMLEIDVEALPLELTYDPDSYTYEPGEAINVPADNVTVTGGVGPYVFSWELLTCSAEDCTVGPDWGIDPTSGEIDRSLGGPEPEANGNRTYRVTVTDSAETPDTATFDVTFEEQL